MNKDKLDNETEKDLQDKRYLPMIEERKEENSSFMKEWHKNNPHPMKGKHHTEETKAKMSQANKGKKLSEEHKKNIGEFHKMKKERESAIVEAYLNGMIVSEIVKKFETGNASIYRILKRNNIELKSK